MANNVYSWGYNGRYQLGDNTTSNKSSPVITARVASYNFICCGYGSSSAVDSSTGNAYTWGTNTYGQLGTNNITIYSSPVLVVGGKYFDFLACGYYTTLGIEAVPVASGNILKYVYTQWSSVSKAVNTTKSSILKVNGVTA